jgi:hypothetical protein
MRYPNNDDSTSSSSSDEDDNNAPRGPEKQLTVVREGGNDNVPVVV